MMHVPVLSAVGTKIGSNTYAIVFLGWHVEIVNILTFRERVVYSMKYEVC